MSWFVDWWQGIGIAGQIMACLAIPSTLVLLLQAILMLIGAGFGGESDGLDSDGSELELDGVDDAEVDFHVGELDATEVDYSDIDAAEIDGDLDLDSDHDRGLSGTDADPLRVITVRGIIAFFAIGGWAGLASLSAGIPVIWSVQIALISGAAAMLLAALALRFVIRMQSSGNLDLRNALSQTAEVYITIPPSRSNTGKIMMTLQERFTEIDAVTDCDYPIKPNTKVVVVGTLNRDCLIVYPIQ